MALFSERSACPSGIAPVEGLLAAQFNVPKLACTVQNQLE
jgi:hypothetical protein